MTEKGPIYGVELLTVLPLSSKSSGMQQALPGRRELERVAEVSERTVAGYECLLNHYKNSMEMLGKLSKANAVMMRRLAEISTGEAIQPAIHAGAGIREAEEILG